MHKRLSSARRHASFSWNYPPCEDHVGRLRCFWRHRHSGDQGWRHGDGEWKLLEFFKDRRFERYNMEKDTVSVSIEENKELSR